MIIWEDWLKRALASLLLLLIILLVVLSWYWSNEPERFNVRAEAIEALNGDESKLVTGYVTTNTLISMIKTLLDKPGGYIHNDITPPGLLIDNIGNWEYGVIIQARDMTRALRNDMSRSQTQSHKDDALEQAESKINFDHDHWVFPTSEGTYKDAVKLLTDYRNRLVDEDESNAQFYARADNLSEWLHLVETRLGSLSQQLSASVGQERLNTDLAGDPVASQSTSTPSKLMVKTPWLQVDDIFYQARGQTWGLIHLLKAVEIDFTAVLEKKNATVSLRQIIRELESTQQPVWSPMILNGSGFGILVNHSLIMASYISRANAAVIDLRALLAQG